MSERNQVQAEVNMEVNLGGIALANPVTVASGTFGYGREYEAYVDLARLGAIIVKGTTLEPRAGNPTPRIIETPAGMLNAVGLQNPGVDVFIQEHLPYLREKQATVIVNIAGNTVEEYARLTAILDKQDGIAGLEVNISCPNVEKGGLQFGTDPNTAAGVVAAVRQNTSLPVIVKLSPNVTDVVAIARAVVEAGADALSLINTLLGMAIDIETRRPVLANIFGGLSGPAIKPVALRMVYQVAREVEVPIMGVGGIVNWQDALEFILAGATAVSIGTGNFINPGISEQIIDDLENYLVEQGIRDIRQLIGAAWL
ncbi:MAG: dihydroorotate dehydrogenase [Syntrophomonadaceae bacterium]|jgi:dihydroorotate dehydrogenase (NAD+) catalytic subunit|nr:dihydroorotate dehydrogenase [Syntrophomonadaceae bacterium]